MSVNIFNRNYDEIRYKIVNLEFEGPLDLLVTMIDKAEMDIREVPIRELTEQYLEYIEGLTDIDYEYAAEFIEMAARLIRLKSYIMIPRPEDEEIAPEEEEFYRDIEAYKMFKQIAEQIKPLEILNRFYREPQYSEDDYRIVIRNFDLDKLTKALQAVMDRIETSLQTPQPREILREKVTVGEKMRYLTEVLIRYKEVCFFDMFDHDTTKEELVTTFLAILELLKEHVATAEQPDMFGDILIKLVDDYKFNEETNGADDGKIDTYN